MAGNLIIGRTEVYWGKVNLTSYNGNLAFPKNEPLVYNVECHLEATNNSPTASMRWNPTGPAFAVYEDFLSSPEKLNQQIVIRWHYAGGKSIAFIFVWSGQSISYGNDMSVSVRMKSELEGMVNSNLRSTSIPEEKTYLGGIKQLEKMYALDDKKLITYSDVAKKDLEKAVFNNAYATDLTFGANVANMAKQNGNIPFAHNIGKAGIAILAPYSTAKNEVVLNGATIPPQQNPNPAKRYGYLLGPGIINSITRESEWAPPQQTKTNTPSTQTKATNPKKTEKEQKTTQNPPSPQLRQTAESAKTTTAPLGTSSAKPNPGISNKDNKDGVDKQNALEEENTAKLSASMFMCPLLTGVKPHDILFIPSLNGKFIEDWIVQSVDYNQTDGGVEISINATRKLGLGQPMNEKAAKPFIDMAKKLKTLEDWEVYAWTLSNASPTTETTSQEGYFTGSEWSGTGDFGVDTTGLKTGLSGTSALARPR